MPISLQVVVSIHAFQQLLVFMNERTNGGASIEWVRGLGRLCMCVYACLLGGVRFLRGEGRGRRPDLRSECHDEWNCSATC